MSRMFVNRQALTHLQWNDEYSADKLVGKRVKCLAFIFARTKNCFSMDTFVRWLTFYAESFTGGLFLWLGLYILSRGFPLAQNPSERAWWRQGNFAAGISFALASWFIFGIAIRSIVPLESEYTFWLRMTWWSAPLALVCWLRAVWLIPYPEQPAQLSKPMGVALWLILFAAAVLALVSFWDGTIFDYRATEATGATWTDYFHVPPIVPRYYIFIALLLLVLFTSAGHLYHRFQMSPRHSHERAEFRWLAFGAILFIIGASIGVVSSVAGRNDWPEHVGYGIAAVGIYFLGQGVLRYNALVEQQIIQQEFRRSLRGSFAAALLFLIIFNLVFAATKHPVPPVIVPLLIYLSVLLTTPLRWLIGLTDWLTLPAWQAQFMWQLTDVRQKVLTSPNKQEALELALEQLRQSTQEAQLGLIREMIEAEIGAIFHHGGFKQTNIMANSQLFELKQVQQALKVHCHEQNLVQSLLTERDKVRFLQGFLARFMQQHFRPVPAAQPVDEYQIEYLLLYKSYVEGKIRLEVISEIEVEVGIRLAGSGTGGRVYSQFLRNARQRLAELLWQHELYFYRV